MFRVYNYNLAANGSIFILALKALNIIPGLLNLNQSDFKDFQGEKKIIFKYQSHGSKLIDVCNISQSNVWRKCAFLWIDSNHDLWFKIAWIMVHQRKQWIHSKQGFIVWHSCAMIQIIMIQIMQQECTQRTGFKFTLGQTVVKNLVSSLLDKLNQCRMVL